MTLTRNERIARQFARAQRTALQEIRLSTQAKTHALTIAMISERHGVDKCGRPRYRQRAQIVEAVPRREGGGRSMQAIRRRQGS